MSQITRRNFLEAAGAAGMLGALAACSTTQQEEKPASTGSESKTKPASEPEPEPEPEETGDPTLEAPSADAYPIEPDGNDVEPKWTSEEVGDGWIRIDQEGGQTLGVLSLDKVIQVDGWAFKDSNGDGKLDLYEDWRQDPMDRSEELASRLTLDNMPWGLFFHGSFFGTSLPISDSTISQFQSGMRTGTCTEASEDNYADIVDFVNAVETWCEENDEFGIPYMCSGDPYSIFDLPDPHALSATMDKDLWRKAGMWMGRAWASVGRKCYLGPQIDIGTNITWVRLGGSMCEDPRVNRDMTREYGGGLQSTWADDEATEDLGWGKDSMACMLKHYFGAGAAQGGRNDHGWSGKYDIFPGDNWAAHLIPFLDGGLHMNSKTEQMAAIMPNYACPYSDDEEYGEIVAGGYSKYQLGILRNAGWEGMITTDWQILYKGGFGEPRAYSIDNSLMELTNEQRFIKCFDAYVDQDGGEFYPDVAEAAAQEMIADIGEEATLERYQLSAKRVFSVMHKLQLFDHPYLTRARAKEVFKSEVAHDFAKDASRKCVVMLKNKGDIIKEGGPEGKPKAYIPTTTVGGMGNMFAMNTGATAQAPELIINEEKANAVFEVVTDNVDAENNVTSLTIDEIKAAAPEYIIYKMAGPDTGSGESGGSSMMSGGTKETITLVPISLQYRPYTAKYDHDPSIAGDVVTEANPSPYPINEENGHENLCYNGQTVTASNEDVLDRLLDIREALPDAKIICILEDTNNVQCVHEFEDKVDVILWSWCWSGRKFADAYGDIISGEFEPYGLLPCQVPLDMDAAEKSLEDVPRDCECYEDEEGNVYDFAFGLNWSGQIKDERYEEYSQEPLTEPETEVIPG